MDDPFAFVDEEDRPRVKKGKKKKPKKKLRPKPVWPGEVPILVEDDLVWEGGAEGLDLRDWLRAVFDCGERVTPHQDQAYLLLLQVLSQKTGGKVTSIAYFLKQAKRAGKPSLARQAACWNETMKRLGYEVPQDRCTESGAKCGRL